MNQQYRILVVAQTTTLATTLVAWLGAANHEFAVVTTFAAAKVHLSTRPDLLITEVKLGEYNGLHLALRGRAVGIRAIVIGPDDAVFAGQAAQLGGAYLTAASLESSYLHALIETMGRDTVHNDLRSHPWRDDVPVASVVLH